MTVSLAQQIEEVERELSARASVYARMYIKGTLRQSHGEFYEMRMQAVLKTLQWLKENEREIREFVAARKEATETAETVEAVEEGEP